MHYRLNGSMLQLDFSKKKKNDQIFLVDQDLFLLLLCYQMSILYTSYLFRLSFLFVTYCWRGFDTLIPSFLIFNLFFL